MQGEASDDWSADWASFMSALPSDKPAAAVYNFEHYTDSTHTHSKPIMITWAPESVGPREMKRLGPCDTSRSFFLCHMS